MKRTIVYLKYLMPLIAVAAFALYLTSLSVFFVADGEVKRRQSPYSLADSTYKAAVERLDKLSRDDEPDELDRSFARRALAATIAARAGLAASAIISLWAAALAVIGITAPQKSDTALNCKFLLRLTVPNKWCMALIPVLCLPYAALPEIIKHLYIRYYGYNVKVGYHGPSPLLFLLILIAVCVALVFIAAPAERELHINAYSRTGGKG